MGNIRKEFNSTPLRDMARGFTPVKIIIVAVYSDDSLIISSSLNEKESVDLLDKAVKVL